MSTLNSLQLFVKFGRIFSGLALLTAPFTIWTATPQGPRSLLHLIYVFWQNSFVQLSIPVITLNVIVTICLINLWLAGLFLLKRWRGDCAQGTCITWLALGLLFVTTIFWQGSTGLAWGYWLCGSALLAGLLLELMIIASSTMATTENDMTRLYSGHVGV